MHRLTPILMAVGLMVLSMLGLTLVANAQRAATHGLATSPDASRLDLYMSLSENGPPQHSFLSDTHKVYAVLDYAGAQAERYVIKLRDLSGIVVTQTVVGPLSGEGKVSAGLTTADFVASYKSGITRGAASAQENADKAATACQSIPKVPDVWPPRPPGPGTPPSQDPYLAFRDLILEANASVRTSVGEVTRTIQSMQGLPDLLRTPQYTGLVNERLALVGVDSELAQIPTLVNPPGPSAENPNPPKPNPQEACRIMGGAKAALETSTGKLNTLLGDLPADVSDWRLPPTVARFSGAQFIGCVQYQVQIFRIVGNQPNDTAAKSIAWSLGDPGLPALIFPSPDLVDGQNVGQVSVIPQLIFAKGVNVPNLNHFATAMAFVTDNKCIPVDGVKVTFGVDPSGAGSVMPREALTIDGLVTTTVESGNDGYDRAEVNATVCEGPCAMGAPDAKPVTGRGRFNVVGPAKAVVVIVNPKVLNRLDPEQVKRGLGVSVRATDQLTGGHEVANGTLVKVTVRGKGQLAYDRQKLVNGVPSGPREQVPLTKSAELITRDGTSIIKPSEDPGYINDSRLYIIPYTDGDGAVTIEAEVDGIKGDSDDKLVNGTTRPSVFIISRNKVFLPMSLKIFDVRATQSFVTLPPPTRTPRPR